jgi:hypothetical protein
MIGGPRRGIVAALLLAVLVAHGVQAGTGFSQSIHRASAFSTQANDYFCTSAVVQTIRNFATGESRHDKAQQSAMYSFGRAHNRFTYGSKGVDPQGVELMLEHYLPGTEWRQIRTGTLQGALRYAARQMRKTGLPAVLFVAGGKHVWTMNGYTSTADPASGHWFRVTHVRFSGPFYPKQKARYGWFDLPPSTLRSVDRLGNAFFPYKEYLSFGDRRWTPWTGYYVAVVPWSVGGHDPDETPTPTPTPVPTPIATPTPTTEAKPRPTLGPTQEPTVEPDPPVTPEAVPATTPGPIDAPD